MSLDHLPSFSEENQVKGTVNFFLRRRLQKKLVVLTILSSAEAGWVPVRLALCRHQEYLQCHSKEIRH